MAIPPRAAPLVLGVRIGDAERGERPPFECLHLLGLVVLHMVEAEQMEHAVHDEMGDVIGEARCPLASPASLSVVS